MGDVTGALLYTILCWATGCWGSLSRTTVKIDRETSAWHLAREKCQNEREWCTNLVEPAIQLVMNNLYDYPLISWKWSETCKYGNFCLILNSIYPILTLSFDRCLTPGLTENLNVIQYLHIPKSGTVINWYLRDYLNCSADDLDFSPPCSEWLDTVSELIAIHTRIICHFSYSLLDWVHCLWWRSMLEEIIFLIVCFFSGGETTKGTVWWKIVLL